MSLEIEFAFASMSRLAFKTLVTLSLAGLLLTGCVHFEDQPVSPALTSEHLESRSLSDTNFRVFLETNLLHQFAEWPATNFDFPALTLAAFYFHPSLDVARAQWAVARGGEASAGARPNPVLGVTPGYSSNPPKSISPWFPSVTLDIPVETAGKRRYRMARAQQLSEVARLNIATMAWQVRSALRAALVEYAAANRRAVLLRKHAGLQQDVTTLLEQRLAAGAIGSLEIGVFRVALVRLRAETLAAEQQAVEARARVAGAVGLPVRALDGVELLFDLNQSMDAALLLPAARREALQGRADVLAALTDYAASQSALQLEIAKQYPDLHFNPGYQFDQGENKWTLGLSVELPVLYRNQGGISEAKAKRDESAARFMALQSRVISEIDRALLNRAASMEELQQLEEVTNVLRQRFQQVEAAFRAGAADQVELALSRLEFINTEQAQLDALMKKQQAVGLLEEALQRPFEGVSKVDQNPRGQTAHNP